MAHYPVPTPLFDTLENFLHTPDALSISPHFAGTDFSAAYEFLKQYSGNQATFESYRREVERLIQWSWLIVKKSILILTRQDIEDYLAFCLHPPKSWIATERVHRFLTLNGERKPNPAWRPFIASVSKGDHKKGLSPDKATYHLSQKTIQEIFTILSSFYNYLLLMDQVSINPIAQIKQKSRYVQKQQQQKTIMRLTEVQWDACFKAAKEMAAKDSVHERTLFIVSALYLLYLRISELAASERWTPLMSHFYQDSNNYWWFKTVGKGNKLRHIAVSDDMLEALKHYRKRLGLSPLPAPNEPLPLIKKERGQGAMTSTRRIRQLVQLCFNQAIKQLQQSGLENEANALEIATTHWLRHTGISDDINKRGRPIAHVRDDAGHSSSGITDRYNDIELSARYQSAKKKKLCK